jgi:hypothetical protein
MPRTRISESSLISDIAGVSTGLVVEVGEDPLDPLLFGHESASMVRVRLELGTVDTCSHVFIACRKCRVSHHRLRQALQYQRY